MSATQVAVLLDIGKSNLKLSVIDPHSRELLQAYTAPNVVKQNGLYPHADVEGIWGWYCHHVAKVSEDYTVRYLSCTTHGATAVCLRKGQLALPVLDYEAELYSTYDEPYSALRPRFEESYSPNLPGTGLNAGRQLYYLSQAHPELFSHVDTVLMYAQFWGWRLSGVAVSELTSLGCHTDLWNPGDSRVSSLVEQQGWAALIPPLKAAGASLGCVLPALQKQLGLPADCEVMNGVHDSNASLVPYLLRSEQPATVISSGTWVIMAALRGSVDRLTEKHDMLANVNAFGGVVPSIRFMGGREWEALGGGAEASVEDLLRVMELGVFALPAFSEHSGPFREHRGRLIGPEQQLGSVQRSALASLYCALVSHHCLNLLGSVGDIYVEGPFAQNTLYTAVLQALRPEQSLAISGDGTGTTQGLLALIQGNAPDSGRIEQSPGIETVFTDAQLGVVLIYCRRWLQLLDEHRKPHASAGRSATLTLL